MRNIHDILRHLLGHETVFSREAPIEYTYHGQLRRYFERDNVQRKTGVHDIMEERLVIDLLERKEK